MQKRPMKVDTLYNGTINRKTEWQYIIGQGFLNGLIFQTGFPQDATLTVRKRSSSGTTVLIQDQPLIDFEGMTSIDYAVASDGIFNTISTLYDDIAGADDGALAGLPNPLSRYTTQDHNILVPLGSHYLDDSELEIKLRLAESGARTEENYVIGTYEDDKAPAFMYQYELFNDLNANYPNVESLFLKLDDPDGDLDGVDVRDLNINVKCKDDDSTYIAGYQLLRSASLILNQKNVDVESTLIKIYQSESEVPMNVHVKLTGQHANYGSVISKSEYYDQKETSENTIAEAEKQVQRIEKLEREKPDEAKARRHAGKLVKSDDLKAEVEQAKKAQKKDEKSE